MCITDDVSLSMTGIEIIFYLRQCYLSTLYLMVHKASGKFWNYFKKFSIWTFTSRIVSFSLTWGIVKLSCEGVKILYDLHVFLFGFRILKDLKLSISSMKSKEGKLIVNCIYSLMLMQKKTFFFPQHETSKFLVPIIITCHIYITSFSPWQISP